MLLGRDRYARNICQYPSSGRGTKSVTTLSITGIKPGRFLAKSFLP